MSGATSPRRLAPLLCALALTASVAAPPAHGQEADDSRAGASALPAGEPRTAAVGGADHDWYVFSAAGSHAVKVTLVNRSGCTLRGDLHVGESVDQAKQQTAEPGQATTWEFIAYGGSSWYYLDVTAHAPGCADGAYDLTAQYQPAPAGSDHPAQLQCMSSRKAERRATSTLARLRVRSQAARTAAAKRRYRQRITSQKSTVRRATQRRLRTC